MKPSMLLYLLSMIVLIHAVSFILNQKRAESFVPAFSFIVDEKSERLPLMVPLILNNKDIKAISLVKNVNVLYTPTDKTPETPSLHAIDSFSFALRHKQLFDKRSELVLTVLNAERGVIMIKPLDLPTKTIFEDDVRIGYYEETDKLVLELIYKCLKDRIIVPKYQLIKIDRSLPINSSLFSQNSLDALMLFSSYENDVVKKQIKDGFRFDVVDYADMIDPAKMGVHSPFAKLRTMDFSSVFPQLKGQYSPKSIIAFDIMIVGSKDINSAIFDVELTAVVRLINKPEVINFYGIFYEVFPQSHKFADELNNFTRVRQKLQILEQFANDDFKYTFNNHVPGFYDSTKNTFIIAGNKVQGIPLSVKANVSLLNQDRVEENGEYQVTESSKRQTIMIKTNPNQTGLKDTSKGSTQFEPGYRCYGHPEIQSKGLCDSDYDNLGERKREKTYWDKPCEKNTDCPFYQKNKNYPNYRGGCIDGMCEMPVGVKQVSNRKYDEKSTPLCHGCKDPLDASCCTKQMNKSEYPTLKSPDYAFELDFFERQRANSS